MGRRALLGGVGAAAAASAAGEASAQGWWPFARRGASQTQTAQTPAPDHAAHDHGGHEGHAGHGDDADPGLTQEEAAVVAALLSCDSAAETCLTHCITLLGQGDTSMAGCADSVRDMLAVCRATRTLMQNKSALAGRQLVVCRDACAACRARCQLHAAHHAQCAACAAACERAIAAINVLIG